MKIPFFSTKALSAILFIAILLGTLVTAFALVARNSLDSGLLINKSGFSRIVHDKQGRLLRVTLSADDKVRIYSSYSSIASSVKTAFLEQEDRFFFSHFGFNPVSLLRAFYSSFIKKKQIGASTISMQLARLKFGINSRSISGKLKQIIAALYLESFYSKTEIFEAYLNSVPFGANIEGIESGAYIYFGKSAKDLNCAESISLAVIPQNPNKRFPDPSNTLYLNAALKLGESLQLQNPSFCPDYYELLIKNKYIKNKLPFLAPHYTEKVLKDNPTELRILSSLDLDLQSIIERITNGFFIAKDKLGLKNAAVLLVDNPSSKIVGYLGSKDFFNTEILGQNDGLKARRSPGSALKPFIYGMAIDDGIIHPNSLLKDTELLKSAYNPENFERDYIGPVSAGDALVRSRNIPAVSLLNQISPERFYNFLKLAGIQKLKPKDFYGLSLVLGGVEVSAIELATLYSSLANQGMLHPLSFLQNSDRTVSTRLFSPEAAFLVLDMLKNNPRPDSALESSHIAYRKQIPWKTGTSFGFKDAWAVGIVGKFTLVVWIGNFDASSNLAFVGRDSAGVLFFKIADALSYQSLEQQTQIIHNLNLTHTKICSVSGELPGPDCLQLKESWFIPGKSPIKTCSLHRTILIDKETGLRSCDSSDTKSDRKVYEFWSSDLLELFEKAGLARKEVPAYKAGCFETDLSGQIPLIVSPQNSISYQLQANLNSIPLIGVTDSDSNKSFWFANDTLIAQTKPYEQALWNPKPGKYLIRLVDSNGRSNQVFVEVQTAAALN